MYKKSRTYVLRSAFFVFFTPQYFAFFERIECEDGEIVIGLNCFDLWKSVFLS